MIRRLLLVACVALLLGALTFTGVSAKQAGPPRTYTVTWTHDLVGVDAFTLWVDGTQVGQSVPTSACAGVAPTFNCASPLTMTTNVPHLVVVKAENLFGVAASDPFSAAPPAARPAAVKIAK